MLTILANAMRIATRTPTTVDAEMKRFQEKQTSRRADREYYRRWAETEGRYLR